MVAKKSKAKSKAKKAKASKAKKAPATKKVAKKDKPTLPMLNELSFVLMFHGLDEEYRELLKEDPAEYMFSVYNMEISFDLKVVENDEKTINLALPFYRPAIGNK